MKVKCVASIAPILYRSELESVVESQSLPVREMREALLLGEWYVAIFKRGMIFLYTTLIECFYKLTNSFFIGVCLLYEYQYLYWRQYLHWSLFINEVL